VGGFGAESGGNFEELSLNFEYETLGITVEYVDDERIYKG
jgi:hypothetical protein